jgi:hypothetical protein
MSDIVKELRETEYDKDGILRMTNEVACTTGLAMRAADEIEQSRKEIAALRKALAADSQTLRLYLGEMTQQEMRTLKAGFTWVLAQARQ